MGFDNECILNIQSLPGEYFCPVCRTLICPSEALQSQCTHLYCKLCLAHVVATTYACPYDGYLLTEADSKPLIESNKSLAETIGNVAVHCLYHMSGCQWQGGLSDCITHCTDCSFGNSPVLCNRCGTQIMHRQVQEHDQTCLGVQPQAQQVESQTQASTTQNQDQPLAASAALATAAAATAASTTTATTTVSASTSIPVTTSAASGQTQGQGNVTTHQQVMAHPPTPEQWYQQQLQYQQYHQHYPGYDPYLQQQYQQYVQYQQQYPQFQVPSAPQHPIQGQQPLPYMAPQPHIQHHPQAQPLPQPQLHLQAQPVLHPQSIQPQLQQQHPPQSQLQFHLHLQPQPQPQLLQLPAQQPYPQPHHPQAQPPSHAKLAGQQLVQPHPQPHHPQPQLQTAQPVQLQSQHSHPQMQQPHPQSHFQQQMQPPPLQTAPQHQQFVTPQQHSHTQIPHPHPLHQPNQQHQPLAHPQTHFHHQLQQHHTQLQSHPQALQTLGQTEPFPHQQLQFLSVHAVSGHQSYPQPHPIQQTPSGTSHQRPPNHHQLGLMHQYPQQPVPSQNQFPPQQHPHMCPIPAQLPIQLAPHMQQKSNHQVMQQGQQIQQHPGMQPPPQQHSLLQQKNGNLHPGQPHQQGAVLSQNIMQPQHSLCPQGCPPHMQQHVPAQLNSQQHVTSVNSLPGHQNQAVAMRPMMQNHGTPQHPSQHSPGSPAKLVKSPMKQHSPNQKYPVEGNPMQQSQLSNSGNQSSLLSSMSAPLSGNITHQTQPERAILESTTPDNSTSEKAGCVPGVEAGMVPIKCEITEASNLMQAQVEISHSIPNEMFPQNIPRRGPGQERMFQDPSHRMQSHEQALAPSPMRPPVHNFQEPLQRQPLAVLEPPMGRQPYGMYCPEAPYSVPQGPGLLPISSARPPLHNKQDVVALGQSQHHMPPSHVGGAPPYQLCFPFRSDPHLMDIRERQWAMASHENLGRKHDMNATHPDQLRPFREFGHQPMDNLPPSPGRDHTGLPPYLFGLNSQSHKQDFHSEHPRGLGSAFHDSSFPIPPNYLCKGGMDGSGDVRMSEQQGLGGEFCSRNLLTHLRVGESSHVGEPTGFGGFQSHLQMRDPCGPGNLPSHLRIGEQVGGGGSYPKHGLQNESGYFSSVSIHRDIESLDHLRMGKAGSTGWCPICKIDCETVEGLDLHSHTREHQKITMEMVLSIKQENDKRILEGNGALEDGKKIKRANFESGLSRH